MGFLLSDDLYDRNPAGVDIPDQASAFSGSGDNDAVYKSIKEGSEKEVALWKTRQQKYLGQMLNGFH